MENDTRHPISQIEPARTSTVKILLDELPGGRPITCTVC